MACSLFLVVRALQRQAVIVEFEKDWVLTFIIRMQGFTLPHLKPSLLSDGSSFAPSIFRTWLVDLVLFVLTPLMQN